VIGDSGIYVYAAIVAAGLDKIPHVRRLWVFSQHRVVVRGA
jgi:hypothetical protein